LVNKNVLSCLLKDGREVDAVTLVGRLFHACVTVTRNDRSPMVLSRVRGTIRRENLTSCKQEYIYFLHIGLGFLHDIICLKCVVMYWVGHWSGTWLQYFSLMWWCVALVGVSRTRYGCLLKRTAPASPCCWTLPTKNSWFCRHCARPPTTSRGASATWSLTSSSRYWPSVLLIYLSVNKVTLEEFPARGIVCWGNYIVSARELGLQIGRVKLLELW